MAANNNYEYLPNGYVVENKTHQQKDNLHSQAKLKDACRKIIPISIKESKISLNFVKVISFLYGLSVIIVVEDKARLRDFLFKMGTGDTSETDFLLGSSLLDLPFVFSKQDVEVDANDVSVANTVDSQISGLRWRAASPDNEKAR
ncbi:unnamed protein product [Acanthoscelides obtectus]|uniref:Uncharacterized protein n=1 Tax=Acanthoscelides obtectus TaxID=200917 RepID=A0A9P0LS02_ACAOB|nr:unnamed protein product [Acanthoscelides obtectus]CAK1654439.1 hypothetical protein AOBTE_LOCUS18595 [Acanthoscelides obtectus]